MKIFITGGTGFVGTKVTKRLLKEGHDVTILSRDPSKTPSLPPGVTLLEGNPAEAGSWQAQVASHDAVINLAGASIFRRWTDANKRMIRESRIETTKNLVEAMASKEERRCVLISTSAIGYYGPHKEEVLDEESPPGNDFLAGLAQEWESAAMKALEYGVRVVLLRFGVVLGREGGALGQMVPIFKKWMGSPLGTGKQWFSWIHEEDLAGIHLFVLKGGEITGPINCTAPHPVRNEQLTKALGEALGKPTFMPAVPGFVIKLKMGEFGSVLLEGQKVLPKRLTDLGFNFKYPDIQGALKDLVG